MEQYRFVVFDNHKIIVENRDYVATGDDIAIRLAEGWRDYRGGQVWRADKLIKQWKRGAMPIGEGLGVV